MGKTGKRFARRLSNTLDVSFDFCWGELFDGYFELYFRGGSTNELVVEDIVNRHAELVRGVLLCLLYERGDLGRVKVDKYYRFILK